MSPANASPSSVPGRFDVRTTSDSHFGWIRTRLAIERTLMAWIRTATALIGFGFTIVQFLQRLQSSGPEAMRPEAPRYLGLALIVAGIAGLLISIWQYRKLVAYMHSSEFAPIAGVEGFSKTPLLVIAIGLTVIGIFAFGAVFLRVA